jgi:hypothetical protein
MIKTLSVCNKHRLGDYGISMRCVAELPSQWGLERIKEYLLHLALHQKAPQIGLLRSVLRHRYSHSQQA